MALRARVSGEGDGRKTEVDKQYSVASCGGYRRTAAYTCR